MKDKFIIDKEINLNEDDFLNTKIYSDNLTKIIRNTEPNKVFTIGLFGKWGTGKSSIINTSEQDFKDKNKIKFIKYDAWQYINDSFRRMFLLKLREELQYDETPEMKRFYENESTDIGSKYKLSPAGIGYILGALIIIIAIVSFISLDIDYKLPVYSIVTLLGLLISIISGAFHQLKISVTKPHLFAPEQFEDCFKDIISHSLRTVNPIRKKWNWIIKNDKSIQNLEKLVIVIDNIDRCSNDLAYNLLTDIKTFLGSGPYSIVFVIPVDDEALKKHIINNNTIHSDGEQEEFLRKFFNVTIRIKPYVETDMYSFAKRICEKSNLNFKPETINIASKEYARNPRRIIQLFNNLLAEINYYDSNFRAKNETLICCILIIREEYPDYYQQIINSPKIFNELDTSTLNNSDNKQNEAIKRFKRITQITLGRVSLADLNKVLTNSHYQFDDIAMDIKDAISTFDSDKVISAWETEKDRISDYIVDKLEHAIKNNLSETDLVAYFDLCSEINSQHPLEMYFAKRIDEKVISYVETIIVNTHNHVNLCKYALSRAKQRDDTFKNDIINYCVRKYGEESKPPWSNLFRAAIDIFKDENTSEKLSSTFEMYPQDIDIKTLSEAQIKFLLSDKFVQKQLDKLLQHQDMGTWNDEFFIEITKNKYSTKIYKLVQWIFEHKSNISITTYAYLFEHVIDTTNQDKYKAWISNQTIDKIAQIIKFINPLLSLIPDKCLSIQPKALYDLIISDRGTQYSRKNFINECLEGNQYIEEVADYVFNIYRITDNKTDTTKEIEKLIENININSRLLALIDKGFSLYPFIDIIVSNLNIDESMTINDKGERIRILGFCFKQTNKKGNYILQEDVAQTKLDDLLYYAYKNQEVKIFAFLAELISIHHYKKILSTLILRKEPSFINVLPKALLELALNSFREDNYFDYAENVDFLSVIVQKGSINQKKYIVKILIDNLDKNKNIKDTIRIINLMQEIPAFDTSGLLYSHLKNYQQENKDAIDKKLNETINKLKQIVKV